MNQQITVPSSLVEFLYTNLPSIKKNSAHECIELLEQNYFVLDSSKIHIQNIFNKIESFPPCDKTTQLKQIFIEWMLIKSSEVSVDNLEGSYELKLSNATNDKLYFDPNFSDKEILKMRKMNEEVEIHSLETFLDPLPFHRLKHLPTRIPLDKDCYYDLLQIVDPFLRSAKQIKIIDPYIFNPVAQKNLWLFLDKYYNSEFTLRLIDRRKVEENRVKEYKDFIDKIEDRKNSGQIISTLFIGSGHVERYLLTEDFQIYLPGGLDSLKNDGNPNFQEDWKIAEIRIDKSNSKK